MEMYSAEYQRGSLFANVTVLRRSFTKLPVRLLGHCVDPGRIDPAIVEVEERANSNRVIDCFIRPSLRMQSLDVFVADTGRFVIHLSDESQQYLIFLRQ